MEMDGSEQLCSLLETEKLRRDLDMARRRIFHRLVECYGDESEVKEDLGLDKGGPLDKVGAIVWILWEAFQQEYQRVLRDQVLRKLEPTPIVTLQDLTSSLCEHLVVRDEEFDAAYPGFVKSVLRKVACANSSRPIAVAVLPRSPDWVDEGDDEAGTLWQNDLIRVWLCDTTGPAGLERGALLRFVPESAVTVCVKIIGCASRQALASMRRKVGPLLRSLYRSFELLHHVEKHGIQNLPRPSPLPYLEYCGFSGDDWSKVTACVDSYLEPPGKADSIHRRLRNAIGLLIEADRQQNDAVGLALCFSAVEALLCNQTEGIVKNLSENAAVLLEANPARRLAAAIAIARLYSLRSRVLHGSDIDQSEEPRMQSRVLAAAVLAAILERGDFLEKLGGEAQPKEFFDELKEARMSGKVIVGVSPSAARVLWATES
jgi:hypothetical protein